MGSLRGAHFSKNSVSLEQIEIFQFCLKIQHLWRLSHPWVGVWVVGWVVGWVDGWGQVKSIKIQINLDLIENISILFEDSTSVETPPPMGGCMGGWVGWWVGSGQITQNQINLDSIEIFQFSLKIYNLWRHPNLWADVWMHGWVNG